MNPITSASNAHSPRPFFLSVNHAYNSVPDRLQAVGLLRMTQGLMLAALLGISLVTQAPTNPLFVFIGIPFNIPRIVSAAFIITSFLIWFSVGYLLDRGKLRTASELFVL